MYHLCLVGFDLYYWLSATKKEGIKDLFVFVTTSCHDTGCGGRVQFTVWVGKIEEDKYFVKNPKSLRRDEKFPLPEQVQCTNCEHSIVVDEEFAKAISAEAEKFFDGLREQRKLAQAPWN